MAGATIGAIRIGLSIATAEFGKDLEKVSKDIGGLRNSAANSLKGAGQALEHGLGSLKTGAGSILQVLRGTTTGTAGLNDALVHGKVGLTALKFAAINAADGVGKHLQAGVLSGAVGMKKLAGAAAPAIGQLSLMTLGALGLGAAIAVKSLRAMDDLGDSASRIGTTADALGALRYATQLTGSEADALDGALLKMNNNLSDAVNKGGPAADALKKIGLDARNLVQQDPAAAFKAIAGGFASLPNDAERAATAMDIFGKSGVGLINTLKAGPDELDRLSAEAQKLGIAINDVDASKAGAANDAIDKLGYAAQGVANTFAIALAPSIVGVTDQIIQFATTGEGAGGVVNASIKALIGTVGFLADTWQILKLVAAPVFILISGAATLVLKVLLGIGRGVEGIINLIPGMKVSFTQGLEYIADIADKTTANLQKDFGKATKEPWAHQATDAFFAKVQSGASSATTAANGAAKAVRGIGDGFAEGTKKIREMVDALKTQIATYGMSSAQVEVYKLKQAGASSEVIAGAQALATQHDALEKQHKAMDEWKNESKKIFEDVMTPLEKYSNKIDKLKTMKDNGLIDVDTFNRASKQAKTDYDKDSDPKKVHAAALEAGTVEERSAVLSYRAQSQSNDPIKAVAKSTAEAAGYQRQSVDFLTKITDALTSSRLVAVS